MHTTTKTHPSRRRVNLVKIGRATAVYVRCRTLCVEPVGTYYTVHTNTGQGAENRCARSQAFDRLCEIVAQTPNVWDASLSRSFKSR